MTSEEESALRSYRDTGHQSFVPPPPDVIVTRARRRARTRVALAAAAVLAVSGGATAIAIGLGNRPDPTPPITVPSPAPSVATTPPSPPTTRASSAPPSSTSSSASPTGTTPPTSRAPSPVSVRGVDWENATIRITASREDECLTGKIRFVDGIGGQRGDNPQIAISPAYDGGAPTYGDLTGDGRAEAVVWASCLAGAGDEDSSGQLLVVSGGTGELVGHWVGPTIPVVKDLVIADERLTITYTERYADPEIVEERTYRWNGSRYV